MQDIWLDGKKFPGQSENYHGLCPIPQSRRLSGKVKKSVPCICVQNRKPSRARKVSQLVAAALAAHPPAEIPAPPYSADLSQICPPLQ